MKFYWQCLPPELIWHLLRTYAERWGGVYREMRSGTIETQEGTRLVYVLAQIGKLAELYEIEKRIIALEAIPKGRK